MCFSNKGKVYWLKVYHVPEATRTSKGRAINNLLPLEDGETVTNVLRVPEFDKQSSIFFATRKGTVKKTALEAYSRPKKGGIRAILLEPDDAVVAVGITRPGDRSSRAAPTARRSASTRPPCAMNRTVYGVRGIRLGCDYVVGWWSRTIPTRP